MIKNHKYLTNFEKEYKKQEKLDVYHNFEIVEAMHKEAFRLGVFPLKNPLEDIDREIKIAKVLNSVH